VANNQHRLRWKDDTSGEASLPRRLIIAAAQADALVLRAGDRIIVAYSLT
jgi:hypothetical protein